MDAGPGDPRRRAGLAGLRRLGPARGRPAAAAARGLLRPAGPVEVAAGPLVKLMREFRPHVVTTYDENGGYPHPDHIMCHKISVAAFDAAGDPEPLPGAGRAVAAAEALLRHRLLQGAGSWRCTRAMLAAGLESPYEEWLEAVGRAAATTRRTRITTRVRVRGVLPGPRRRAAGPRHPGRPGRLLVPGADGDPAAGLADRGLRAGPLDWSRRPLPESDLFAGVREPPMPADRRRGYAGTPPHIGGTPC